MPIQINNVPRRVVYAASGTGPYAFTFEILAAGDIAVYKDDTLLTITTDYTVTIASNGTGSVTLTASPVGATQIAIVGNRTIARTTDFTTGGDFFANTLNDELDQQTIFSQQNAEGLSRALQAPQTDPTTIDMTLPRKTDRAGKYLAFDAVTGNPIAGEGRTEVSAVYAIRNEIQTVAGVASSVPTVAGVASSIPTVAGLASSIPTVASNSANVTTVATNIANVNTNATNIASINTNASNIAAIQTASANAIAVQSALSQVSDGVRDRFVAGVGYTKNTTTTLTLSQTPLKSETVKVFFDGVYQEKTTWSRSGAVITFTSAIPSNAVEVTYDIGRSFAELDAAVASADADASTASTKASEASVSADNSAASAALSTTNRNLILMGF